MNVIHCMYIHYICISYYTYKPLPASSVLTKVLMKMSSFEELFLDQTFALSIFCPPPPRPRPLCFRLYGKLGINVTYRVNKNVFFTENIKTKNHLQNYFRM